MANAKAGTLFWQITVNDKKAMKSFNIMGGALSKLAGLAAGALAGFSVVDVVKTGADFERTMSRVLALTSRAGETAEESTQRYRTLSQAARDMGRKTVFSATQAADAMSKFALAGFNADEIIKALPQALDLAAAGELDMATAAGIVSNIMRGFGVDTEDLAKSVDVLTTAFTTSNTDLVQLGEAMKYVGPVAKATGKDVEEITAAMQLMANAGIQGSMAGTSMRNILTRMSGTVKEVNKLMKGLGIETKNANGQLLPMVDIIRNVDKATKNMQEADRLTVFSQIAGLRGLAGFTELVEQGADTLQEFENRLRGSDGAAKRIATTMMDNVSGGFTIFLSALESLKISVFDAMNRPLRQFAERITGMANRVEEFATKYSPLITGLTEAFTKAIEGIANGLGGLINELLPKFFGMLSVGGGTLEDTIENVGALIGNWDKLLQIGFLKFVDFGLKIASFLGGVWTTLGSGFSAVFSDIVSILKYSVGQIWGMIKVLISHFDDFFTIFSLRAEAMGRIVKERLTGISDKEIGFLQQEAEIRRRMLMASLSQDIDKSIMSRSLPNFKTGQSFQGGQDNFDWMRIGIQRTIEGIQTQMNQDIEQQRNANRERQSGQDLSETNRNTKQTNMYLSEEVRILNSIDQNINNLGGVGN